MSGTFWPQPPNRRWERPPRGGISWTVDVTAWFRVNRPDVAKPIEMFLAKLRTAGCLLVGTSAQTPSLAVAIDTASGRLWPYAVFTTPNPVLNVNVDYLAKAGSDTQERFLQTVHEALPDLKADLIRAAGYRKRPGVDPAVLSASLAAACPQVWA